MCSGVCVCGLCYLHNSAVVAQAERTYYPPYSQTNLDSNFVLHLTELSTVPLLDRK